MDYIFYVSIPWVKIGCNPGSLILRHSDSVVGAERLFKWLDNQYPGSVAYYEDISEQAVKFIGGNPDCFDGFH